MIFTTISENIQNFSKKVFDHFGYKVDENKPYQDVVIDLDAPKVEKKVNF